MIMLVIDSIAFYNLGKNSTKIEETQNTQTEEVETKIYSIKKMPDEVLSSYSKSYLGDERLYYLIEKDNIYEPTNTLTSSSYYVFEDDLRNPYIEITYDKEIFHFRDEKQIQEYLKSKNK